LDVDDAPETIFPAPTLTYGTCTIIGGAEGACAPAFSEDNRQSTGRNIAAMRNRSIMAYLRECCGKRGSRELDAEASAI
jgi:hypothetical protein